jgi:hypothetical protein
VGPRGGTSQTSKERGCPKVSRPTGHPPAAERTKFYPTPKHPVNCDILSHGVGKEEEKKKVGGGLTRGRARL